MSEKQDKGVQEPKAPPLKGFGVVIYPLGGGKFGVQAVDVEDKKIVKTGRECVKDAKRSTLSEAENMLIDIASERLE